MFHLLYLSDNIGGGYSLILNDWMVIKIGGVNSHKPSLNEMARFLFQLEATNAIRFFFMR